MKVKITLFADINTNKCSLSELVNQAADCCYDYDVEVLTEKELDKLLGIKAE